jgi:hypothetical protein
LNEYTRREEVRWTLIASLALVLCIGPAVFLLVTVQGKLVPDPAARAAAHAATERAAALRPCVVAAERLYTEVDVLKTSAKAAHLDAEQPPPAPPRRKPPTRGNLAPKEKEPDAAMAWPAAQSSLKQAKQLAPCRVAIETTGTLAPELTPAWDAIVKAADLSATATAKNDQITAARALLKLLADAPVDKIREAARRAEADQKKAAEALQATADTAMIREGIPEGILSRRVAVAVGVGLSVITLLLSYLSVRAASERRLTTLVPLREAAKSQNPGLHAAAVLRLASHHNGGQPGMVVGAALSGVIAAALIPADTDVFILGVMGGCILGLALQWVYRLATGASSWRGRVGELAEVEKPAIPIVLVLSSVKPGHEGNFITFLNDLSVEEASATVEKLAAQAEEKILAAADAGAAARQQSPSAASR